MVFNHAGMSEIIRQFRNGKELKPLLKVNGSMTTLKTVFLDKPRAFQKGDLLVNECIFNTSRSNITVLSLVIELNDNVIFGNLKID